MSRRASSMRVHLGKRIQYEHADEYGRQSQPEN